MDSFGRKVREAVESRGLSLEDVARATGLGVEQVEALTRDEFGDLPDGEDLRQGLHAFARLVDVDPEAVIEDYERERERQDWHATVPIKVPVAEVEEPTREPEEVVEPPSRRIEPVATEVSTPPARSRKFAVVLGMMGVAVVLGAYFLWPSSSRAPEFSPALDASPAPTGEEHSRVREDAVPGPGKQTPSLAGMQAAPAEAAPEMRTARTPDAAADPIDAPVSSTTRASRAVVGSGPSGTGLSIPEYGVGRGVIDHVLVDEGSRFTEGERVWFWTLVTDGAAGASIDHVWIHEGEEVLRVPLNVGGARWRTQSYKDLPPGATGRWAVEARDGNGRVLARGEFDCAPAR